MDGEFCTTAMVREDKQRWQREKQKIGIMHWSGTVFMRMTFSARLCTCPRLNLNNMLYTHLPYAAASTCPSRLYVCWFVWQVDFCSLMIPKASVLQCYNNNRGMHISCFSFLPPIPDENRGVLWVHIYYRDQNFPCLCRQKKKKLSDARTTLERRDLEKHHQLDSFYCQTMCVFCTDQVVHDAATFYSLCSSSCIYIFWHLQQ